MKKELKCMPAISVKCPYIEGASRKKTAIQLPFVLSKQNGRSVFLAESASGQWCTWRLRSRDGTLRRQWAPVPLQKGTQLGLWRQSRAVALSGDAD